jgi:hypothetical protein
VTPSALGLWLLADPAERSQAMIDLIASQDLLIVADSDTFAVVRAHDEIVWHLETGNHFPLAPMALV